MNTPNNSRQLIRTIYRIDRRIVKLSKADGKFSANQANSVRLSKQVVRRIKNNPGRYNAALGKSGS